MAVLVFKNVRWKSPVARRIVLYNKKLHSILLLLCATSIACPDEKIIQSCWIPPILLIQKIVGYKHKLEEELDSHILNTVNPDEYLSGRTLSSSNKRSRLSSSRKTKLQEPTVPKRVDPESHSSEFTRLLVQDLYYKPPEESEPFLQNSQLLQQVIL